jgi:hypothetical protein
MAQMRFIPVENFTIPTGCGTQTYEGEGFLVLVAEPDGKTTMDYVSRASVEHALKYVEEQLGETA